MKKFLLVCAYILAILVVLPIIAALIITFIEWDLSKFSEVLKMADNFKDIRAGIVFYFLLCLLVWIMFNR